MDYTIIAMRDRLDLKETAAKRLPHHHAYGLL